MVNIDRTLPIEKYGEKTMGKTHGMGSMDCDKIPIRYCGGPPKREVTLLAKKNCKENNYDFLAENFYA